MTGDGGRATGDPAAGLGRFVDAQASAIDDALAQLAAARKTSHWMWFVFPQLHGLGRSSMARHYAIRSRAEALAYLAHPVLGPRLRRCVELALAAPAGASAHAIFGSPDDLKFHSCLTLFDAIGGDEHVFRAALRRFFGGRADDATLRLLDA
jgi:uncharacterized protein (DUF1810 family)